MENICYRLVATLQLESKHTGTIFIYTFFCMNAKTDPYILTRQLHGSDFEQRHVPLRSLTFVLRACFPMNVGLLFAAVGKQRVGQTRRQFNINKGKLVTQ